MISRFHWAAVGILLRVTVLTVMALLCVTNDVSAHVTLLSSEPAAGATLQTAPSRIRLVFSEPIDAGSSEISVWSVNGTVVRLITVRDPRDVRALVADASAIGTGAFRVEWRTLSADGHVVTGSFVFSVGEAPATSAALANLAVDTGASSSRSAAATVSITLALFRGAALGCLMALMGLLAFLRWSAAPIADREMTVASRLSITATLLMLAYGFQWASAAAGASAFSTALVTTAGQLEVLRVLLTALATWALVLARRRTIALVFAALAVAISGAIGHPQTYDTALTLPAKVIHLLGGALWAGGLLWLLLHRSDAREPLLAKVRRYSAVALIAVIAVAASGILQSLLFLEQPADLLRTAYGQLVLSKIALLFLVIGLGAYHRFRVLPTLAGADVSLANTFRRTLTVEVVIVLLAALVGAVLSQTSPR